MVQRKYPHQINIETRQEKYQLIHGARRSHTLPGGLLSHCITYTRNNTVTVNTPLTSLVCGWDVAA